MGEVRRWAWAALLCLWFFVHCASEEASWFAFVLTLAIAAPPCPPSLIFFFLPSLYVPSDSLFSIRICEMIKIKILRALTSTVVNIVTFTFLSCMNVLIMLQFSSQVPSGFMYTVEIYDLTVNFKAALINIFVITMNQCVM